MLFQKDQYLSTATPEPRSLAPDMKLLNTQTVSVTYYYASPANRRINLPAGHT